MPTRSPIRPPAAVPSHSLLAGRVLRCHAAVRVALDDRRAAQLDLSVCVELLEPGEPGVGQVVLSSKLTAITLFSFSNVVVMSVPFLF